MGGVPVFAHGDPLTRRDLESIRDDRHRYELVDGALVMSPSPRPVHQRVVARLLAALSAVCPDDCEVLPAPVDVVLAEDTVLIPDVVVGLRANFTDRALMGAPVLAVEVVSPSSRTIDRHLKPARLAAAGCPYYWVVDPIGPTMSCLSLSEGGFVSVVELAGADSARIDEPFGMELSVQRLVSTY